MKKIVDQIYRTVLILFIIIATVAITKNVILQNKIDKQITEINNW